MTGIIMNCKISRLNIFVYTCKDENGERYMTKIIITELSRLKICIQKTDKCGSKLKEIIVCTLCKMELKLNKNSVHVLNKQWWGKSRRYVCNKQLP